MLIDIIDTTDEQINEIVKHSREQSIPVMYLENNGVKDHRWDMLNLQPWLIADLDE